MDHGVTLWRSTPHLFDRIMNDWLEYNLFFFGTQTKHKTLVFWGVKPVKPSRSLWATRTELWFDVSEEGLIDWLYGDLPGIPESQANVNEQILLYLKIANAFLIAFWDAPFWCTFIAQVVFLYYTTMLYIHCQFRSVISTCHRSKVPYQGAGHSIWIMEIPCGVVSNLNMVATCPGNTLVCRVTQGLFASAGVLSICQFHETSTPSSDTLWSVVKHSRSGVVLVWVLLVQSPRSVTVRSLF